jgi:hypothetical protein
MKEEKQKKREIPPFEDSALIYFSAEDKCWIAHSLRTDQIGTGVDMGRAFADLIRGIDNLLDIAEEDETVDYLRDAAPEIVELAAKSKPLPREIYEVAHKLARGEWPENDIEPIFAAQDDQETFKADLCESH